MHFHRAHVEITNICGLACSFCPPKLQPTKTMTLDFFTTILLQLKPYTKALALHVMGDPLTLSNLHAYLDAAHERGFEVELTTSGYYLHKTPLMTLFHPCVRQLNISLNSYNKNALNLSFESYMSSVLDVCKDKLQNYPKPFINLRLWNMDETQSALAFNSEVFEKFASFFEIELNALHIHQMQPKSLRLASKILLHFDNYFEWPSLASTHDSDATCYGLRSHIAILANGVVVPCCLDGEGVINLGNLHERSLDQILHSQRAQAMREGFSKNKAVEELCRKCSYKDRFQSQNTL
ncbi:MAG: SPASM domain-containing protein [Sulfurimonas sp.]|nr:SPASM domain-containing protein [Sulfurimonas sp.]MDD5203738.1 SPASM domain-containing protein [Sulfurimonas sp.]